jgi:hypothetical protein
MRMSMPPKPTDAQERILAFKNVTKTEFGLNQEHAPPRPLTMVENITMADHYLSYLMVVVTSFIYMSDFCVCAIFGVAFINSPSLEYFRRFKQPTRTARKQKESGST